MLQPIRFAEERGTPCPTVADFLKTFNEEMHSLYLLSFLLTADHDKAERCLVSAMGECMEGMGLFMAGAAVIRDAIQTIKPAPEHTDYVSFISLKISATQAENNPFAPILLLDAF